MLDIQFQYETDSPITSPPIKVRGRFLNFPKIAAAYALTTSNVRARTPKPPSSGEIKTPATAANIDPIAQLCNAARLGRPPLSSTRLVLSTTARIVIPIFVL